jgi:hypothetical protein
MQTDSQTTPKSWFARRAVRFSLRTLLIVVTITALALGYLSFRAQRQAAAVKAIQQMGGVVTFQNEITKDGVQLSTPRSAAPSWFGHLYYERPVKISFERPDDQKVQALTQLDLSRVEHLLLVGGPLTDNGLSFLTSRSLPNLRRLRVDETHISDAGLAALSLNLPNLEKLYISSTNVGNDGINHLSNMKALVFLDVTNTKVNAQGIESLKAKLPNLKVSGPE